MPPDGPTASALPAPPDGSRLSQAELVEVRDRLRGAGMDDDDIGTGVTLASGHGEAARLAMIRAALRDLADTKSLLARVFVYGDTASSTELEAALGPTTVGRLVDCNLLRTTTTGEQECPIQLRPLAGLLVASDPPGCAGDAVMALGSGTADLARALPRPPLGRVVDVGTGSGAIALLAAARGAVVTATDITERACAFTRFNAAFNGLDVEVRAGDLYGPIEGQQFDLVLSQPPFVVQPPDVDATTYLHGGPRGDELALRILGGLDGVLAPGGCALLRFDAHGTQDEVVSRVRAGVPNGLDVAVFGFPTAGPDVVALGYAVVADPSLGIRYRQEVGSYSRHLAGLGLDRFTGTLTVVHRPVDGRAPVTVSAPGRSAPRWPYITARLAGERLAAAPDGDLLVARLGPLPEARLTAELAMDDPGPGPSYAVRYPSGAVSPDVELDEAGAAVLQLFVGGRDVGAALAAYAEAASRPLDEVAPEVLAFARSALRRGLLVPSVRPAP